MRNINIVDVAEGQKERSINDWKHDIGTPSVRVGGGLCGSVYVGEFMSDYNGHLNYETWNMSPWIGNDEGLSELAKESRSYKRLIKKLSELEIYETPDGVAWNDSCIDVDSLDEMIGELWATY